jgi:hypothetical protein
MKKSNKSRFYHLVSDKSSQLLLHVAYVIAKTHITSIPNKSNENFNATFSFILLSDFNTKTYQKL